MHQRSHLGSYGENVIADLIQKQGFTILARNYRRFNGEIDLIAMQDNLLVFIEVKTRQKRYFDLSLVITPSKQRKIIAVAKNYMATHNHHAKVGRFDVALVQGDPAAPEITYIPNAFVESNF